MVYFFRSPEGQIIAVDSQTAFSAETADTLTWKTAFSAETADTLTWLFSGAELLQDPSVTGTFIGPRREMITPWSTAAVEITQNMNITGIARIEEFFPVPEGRYASDTEIPHDKMLQRIYHGLDGDIFVIDRQPEPIRHITDFEAYNKEEGLALSEDEIQYLKDLSAKLGRLIKKTSAVNPGRIVSAYKDNCAFIEGPKLRLFHPTAAAKPSFFKEEEVKTVISLKAETHNFPTTVEPFNGAALAEGRDPQLPHHR